MPGFAINVPHSLDQTEAATRIKGLLEKVKEKFKGQVSELEESWEGDVLNFGFKSYGFKISGIVLVESSQVKLDGKLPFAAMMFKGKIEQSIQDELAKLLA